MHFNFYYNKFKVSRGDHARNNPAETVYRRKYLISYNKPSPDHSVFCNITTEQEKHCCKPAKIIYSHKEIMGRTAGL